jgi:hypothetical protein
VAFVAQEWCSAVDEAAGSAAGRVWGVCSSYFELEEVRRVRVGSPARHTWHRDLRAPSITGAHTTRVYSRAICWCLHLRVWLSSCPASWHPAAVAAAVGKHTLHTGRRLVREHTTVVPASIFRTHTYCCNCAL